MKKIVLATDFSDNAGQAAACAAGIAAKCGATLYILHAMDGATDPVIEPVALDTVLLERYTRERFDRLRAVKQHIADQYASLRTELRLSRAMAADAILALSRKEQADLIIMGAHGGGRLKELAIGSVAADVIDHSNIPVMAVPPEYIFHEPDTFLLAIKRPGENAAPLNVLIGMAASFGARIDIVSFVNSRETGTPDDLETEKQLNYYTGFLQRSFPALAFTSEKLDGDDFQLSIDRYCRSHDVDMVALFKHPRHLLDMLCCRNNTRRAVFHSHVPVLVLPGS
ncbi:MAG TPA: universal stress protein [Puia sp.]|uniref:universal stress protein n=1 Tax=Puia sp. TaxID=2045100 RepID=UPI002C259DAA|nr:universal stress protein [Puia sp.]HVU94118.1 universal stress protein [Puia sp.]